jgi:hypothetical protein
MMAQAKAEGMNSDDSDNEIEGLGLPEGIIRSNDDELEQELNDSRVIVDEDQIEANAAEDLEE